MDFSKLLKKKIIKCVIKMEGLEKLYLYPLPKQSKVVFIKSITET